MNAIAPRPPAFVEHPAVTKSREVTRQVATFRLGIDTLPLCAQRINPEAIRDRLWRHYDAEAFALGGCHLCAFIRAGHAELEEVNPAHYADDAGHARVAAGVWSDDTLLTARQLAEKYGRRR